MNNYDNKTVVNKLNETSVTTRTGVKKQWLIVSVIFIAAMLIIILLYVFKPEAEKVVVEDEPPLAEYVVAKSSAVAIPVFSQGSVKAKTHIKLLAEVSGKITQLVGLKYDGGFFAKDELLLRIDNTDYQLAISRANAQVSSAQQQLARVSAEAAQARYDLKQIGRDISASSPYALREPHMAEATANLQAAQADLKIAQRELQRTEIKAPFNGRVVNKQVDVGQYVSPGSVLADIYSTDMAQVRLPLSLQQIELLGLGLRNNQGMNEELKIVLSASQPGSQTGNQSGNQYPYKIQSKSQWQWQASYSHTEGELDARNRQVYVVVQIAEPYSTDDLQPDKPPLTPGMFVKAEISGVAKPAVFALPRGALRYGNEVWIINQENILQKKQVTLYAKDRNSVYIKSGLQQGDKVITGAIDYVLEGMALRPVAHQQQTALEKNPSNE